MRIYCLRCRVEDDSDLLPATLRPLPPEDRPGDLEEPILILEAGEEEDLDGDPDEDPDEDFEDDEDEEDEDFEDEDEDEKPAARRNRLLEELEDLGVDHDGVGD